MALFRLTLPPDKPKAFRQLREAGFPVRRQDGEVVIEVATQAEADAAQVWINALDVRPTLKAGLLEAIREEASRRIQVIIGPAWRRENAQMRATRICWRQIRRILHMLDPVNEPEEPPLTNAERNQINELLQAEQIVRQIRNAGDLIEADVLAMTDEATLRAFDPATSPRWP